MKKRAMVIYDKTNGKVAVEIDISLVEADILSQILVPEFDIKWAKALTFDGNGRVQI